MEANELRIGNWVIIDNEFYKVNSGTLVLIERGIKIAIPIPLTEEWLIRFGAETYEFDNGEPNQYRIGNRLFVLRDGQIVDYGSSVVLKYVHQLQNLYFALNQTELTLKDNV